MTAMTRRKFLRTVAGGVAAAALLRGGRAGGQGTAGASITPFILTVYCSGGWDQTMVFDPKIGAALVAQEPGAVAANGAGNIAYVDHPSRPSVKAFFDKYGANAAIVNGISTGSMVTRYAVRNVLGAVPPGKLRPVDWLSFYTASLRPVLDIPHAVIDAPYMPGDFTSVATRLTTETIKQYGVDIPGAEALGANGEAALATFRRGAFAKLYEGAGDNLDGEKFRALYYGQGREGVIGTRISAALTALGEQGGDSDWVRNAKTAVELFAAGASLTATVQAGADLAWDTRTAHFARASALFEDLFAGIDAVMEHAAAIGVLERTIIMLVSEGGRSPQLNAQAGKGPWAFTSTLLWGPGIAGGTTAGLTDAALRGMPIDPLFGGQTGPGAVTIEMRHLMAALYVKTNVPHKLILPDTTPLSIILSQTETPR